MDNPAPLFQSHLTSSQEIVSLRLPEGRGPSFLFFFSPLYPPDPLLVHLAQGWWLKGQNEEQDLLIQGLRMPQVAKYPHPQDPPILTGDLLLPRPAERKAQRELWPEEGQGLYHA